MYKFSIFHKPSSTSRDFVRSFSPSARHFLYFSYLGEKLPNTHGLGSFARTASSYSVVITRHFELNLKLVFTGFYTVLTVKNASKVVRQGISFASRRHAAFVWVCHSHVIWKLCRVLLPVPSK